jgi:hypothetical protein
MVYFHHLTLGDIFYIVGLEADGMFELLRISDGSAYVRSTARKTRKAFETYAGAEVKAFTAPADGYNISRNTSVVKENHETRN